MTVESLARRYEITRRQPDEFEFILKSQQSAAGKTTKKFSEQIVAVQVPSKNRAESLDEDERANPNTTFDTLERLKPVFDPEGGYCPELVRTKRRCCRRSGRLGKGNGGARVAAARPDRGLRICGGEAHGGGIRSCRSLTQSSGDGGLKGDDLDLRDVNFCSAVIAVNHELRWDPAINVNGGAIAFGIRRWAAAKASLFAWKDNLRASGPTLFSEQ